MYFQEGVQDVDIVLTTYLEHWNGLVHAPLILKLLARCKMYPFECKYIHSSKIKIQVYILPISYIFTNYQYQNNRIYFKT